MINDIKINDDEQLLKLSKFNRLVIMTQLFRHLQEQILPERVAELIQNSNVNNAY